MRINKPLYYILNILWGFPMTLLGAIAAFFLIITGHKPKRWGGVVYFTVGENWGGMELGLFFIVDKKEYYSTKCHEYGHSMQNALLGIFYPIVVAIPSAIRYWIFVFRERAGKENPDYDSIWFEGQATRWGTTTINQWKYNGKN